jgi:stearoyl-CoA desaturase (delta-9 desaturase)
MSGENHNLESSALAGVDVGERDVQESDGSRPNWTNIVFIAVAHGIALLAIIYLVAVRCSGWTLALGAAWFALSGLSITGGYHRLFAHRSYSAAAPLRAFYLAFGAAAVQNSAVAWAGDHRAHHSDTDGESDPYNIRRGFWWAHLGWVLYHAPERDDGSSTRDLLADRLVRFQHRHYVTIALLFGALLPAALGKLWGDPLGALLVVGFLRLVIQWHMTFAINSVAHWIGRRPYCTRTSARDSFVTALLSLGEGYHNFHHRFQADYRNGMRWYHFDPTKWFVWSLARVGVTKDLSRTPPAAIERARQLAADSRRERTSARR